MESSSIWLLTCALCIVSALDYGANQYDQRAALPREPASQYAQYEDPNVLRLAANDAAAPQQRPDYAYNAQYDTQAAAAAPVAAPAHTGLEPGAAPAYDANDAVYDIKNDNAYVLDDGDDYDNDVGGQYETDRGALDQGWDDQADEDWDQGDEKAQYADEEQYADIAQYGDEGGRSGAKTLTGTDNETDGAQGGDSNGTGDSRLMSQMNKVMVSGDSAALDYGGIAKAEQAQVAESSGGGFFGGSMFMVVVFAFVGVGALLAVKNYKRCKPIRGKMEPSKA